MLRGIDCCLNLSQKRNKNIQTKIFGRKVTVLRKAAIIGNMLKLETIFKTQLFEKQPQGELQKSLITNFKRKY